MMVRAIASTGRGVIDALANFGRFARFTGSTLMWMVSGPGRWGRLNLLTPQLFAVGTRSIPVIMLLGAFIGMVLAVEAFAQFAAIGQEARLGGIINISVVKQIGPVLAGVMLAGRVGSAISAELGTMRVTEQLDALRAMGADPVAHLVVPRVIACTVMIPVLTVVSDITGIAGGYLLTVHAYGVSGPAYWEFSERFVSGYAVFNGLTKSLVFGIAIGLISCYKGFHCRSGAAGVGRAATDSFVTSCIAIIMANFFLAKFLNDLYHVIYGYSTVSAFTG
jgi:phospholipid/cholesterol/gamma-HCH transport system permease protein